jgi:hypothetical protein
MRKVLPLGTPMSGYRIDQLVENLVVAELKVVSSSSASSASSAVKRGATTAKESSRGRKESFPGSEVAGLAAFD